MGDRSGDALRTFVGVPLAEDVRESAARLTAKLRRGLGDDRAVKWEPRDNLHVTLHFLGDTAESQLASVEAALEAAAGGHGPFDLSLGAAAWFPGRGQPRVFVVAVADGSRELAAIQSDVGRGLSPLGFPPDSRPFRAHVTVGRVRRGRGLPGGRADAACAGVGDVGQGARVRVAEVVLFQSTLSPAGAVYSRLAAFPLARET
jgi:2'-5' RNA ligase